MGLITRQILEVAFELYMRAYLLPTFTAVEEVGLNEVYNRKQGYRITYIRINESRDINRKRSYHSMPHSRWFDRKHR